MTVNGLINFDLDPAVVQTTDGSTTVTILTAPAFGNVDDGGQIVTFDVVGVDFPNDEIATAKIVVKLKNVGGTPSIVGVPVHLIPISAGSSSGLVTASVNVIIAGTNLKVNVIGVTGRTIDWSCSRSPSFQVLNNLAAITLTDGYVPVYDATNHRWKAGLVEAFSNSVAAGGDLEGSYPNPEVAALSYSNGNIAIGVDTGGASSITQKQLVSGSAGQLALTARDGLTGADGANLYLTAGSSGSGSGSGEGGDVYLNAGSTLSTVGAVGGTVNISAGGSGLKGGDIIISAGAGTEPANSDGYIYIGNLSCDLIRLQLSNNDHFTLGSAAGLGSASCQLTTIGPFTVSAGSTITLGGGAPIALSGSGTTMAGTLALSSITSSSSASGGAATALPAQPQGYITVTINGTDRKIPYYAT